MNPDAPLDLSDDPNTAAAMAAVGAQLAAATGAVKSLAQLVAHITDDMEQFGRVMRRVSSGATPTDAIAEALPAGRAGRNPVATPVAAGPGPWAPPAPTAARRPTLAQAADAGEAAFQERKAQQGGGVLGEMAATLHDIREVARLVLTKVGTGGGPAPDKLKAAKPASWLAKLRERAKEGIGRVGRKVFGDKGYQAVTRGAGAMRSAISAGRAAAVGRGVVGGVASGAMGGPRPGAAAGPAGAVAGMVAGAVAAAGKSLFDAGASVFTTLAGSITRYLTPVALVSQAINSQSSAYSVVGKSFQLLGTVLGALLMPAFLSLAAVVFLVATKLAGPVLDAVEKFGGKVVNGAATAVELFAAVVGYVTEKAHQLAAGFTAILNSPLLKLLVGPVLGTQTGRDVVGGVVRGAVGGSAGGVAGGVAADDFNDYLRRTGRSGLAKRLGADPQPNDPGAADDASPDGLRGEFKTALKTVGQAFKQGLAPQSQSTGVSEYTKSLQLAALNQNPIDAKIHEVLVRLSEKVDRIIDGVDAGNRPPGGQ